jgi:hypothetical protein
MRIAKPVLWIVVGLVIGASGVSATRTVERQQRPPNRLEVTAAYGGALDNSAFFIKDSKSGACWLALRLSPSAEVSLAAAPREACE